jgi:hypothetical protein
MRRMVEGRQAVRGLTGFALRSALLVLAIGPGARATVDVDGNGDGPELSPPSEMPKTAKPLAPARPKPTSPSPGNGRAVLALPGITTSSTRTPPVITSTPSTSTSTVEPPDAPGELRLDGPLEMPGVPPAARPRPGTTPNRADRAIPLEPLPMDESSGLGDPDARSNPPARRPSTTSSRPEPLATPPGRRGRFFGLVPGPMVGPPTPRSTVAGRSATADSPDEPAVDSALKKRIEKQAREAVGDRARLLEVRVAGKEVSIQARGVRFYQKRAVRKSLESIPALSGLRSSIDVGD